MTNVYVLSHFIEMPVEEDDIDRLIGIFSTEENAERAIPQLRNRPAFRDHPDGFQIGILPLNRTGWTEGFLSYKELMEDHEDDAADEAEPEVRG